MATRSQLIERARRAIERDEDIIYDVTVEHGQIVANVRHMRWFLVAVASELIATSARWAHLDYLE